MDEKFLEDEKPTLSEISTALYAAMEDDAVDRKWKKKAVNLMVEITELQREMGEDPGQWQKETEKYIRQAQDLLNQLNRY